MVDAWDLKDEQRRIGTRAHTVGEHFANELPLLQPLPEEELETGLWSTPRVNRYAQITVRMNTYSVPVRYIDRKLRVLLHASQLVVYDGRTEVARHERRMTKGGTRVELDHYLELLLRRPGALPGATALEQARAAGRFTPIHDAWWAAACKIHGDAEGTRALIQVLLLHRHQQHELVVAGIAAALKAGALTADAVALVARRVADDETGAGTPGGPQDEEQGSPQPAVRSLTEQRLRTRLPEDDRPLPSVDRYDHLLPSRTRIRAEPS